MGIKKLDNESINHVKKGDLEYIQFKNLSKYDSLVTHCFTTRKGGVSTGECSTLNMGFNRKDQRENVEANYKRISEALGIDYKNMAFSNQVHDSKVRIVTENDRGKGILRESDIIGYDGLITNCKEVVLVTFYADCVPLFFLDPVKEVIALSHSGWRSSVKGIGRETIEKMHENFGCSPVDIVVGIGPSISQCCFEVGEEVYEEFAATYPWCTAYIRKTDADKWHIHLQEIIKKTLVDAGVSNENISISGICTKCNKDVFFSHRGDQGKTGSLAAIMQLRNT
ncbi:MAG: peptidoglycan editing factor PgeF [Clostridia bacterium]|nr:peptidoglycan editing factor PgeF [Clostridia bacterium]